jgi:hypothetical protein
MNLKYVNFLALYTSIVLLFPTVLTFPKLILLAVLIVCSILKYPYQRALTDIDLLLIFCFLNGSWSILYGWIQGYPALKLLYPYVVFPILLLLLSKLPFSFHSWKFLFRIISATNILLCIFAYAFYFFPDLTMPLFSSIFGSLRVGFNFTYGSFTEFGAGEISIPTLPYIFYTTCILTTYELYLFASKHTTQYQFIYPIGSRSQNIFFILLNLGIIVLSGRRALILFLPLPPLIVMSMSMYPSLLTSFRLILKTKFIFLLLSVAIILTSTVLFIPSLLNSLVFAFSTVSSDPVRSNQLLILSEAFFTKPIFGWGHAASVPDYIRSVTHPWSYELTYNTLAFHIGLFGILIYLICSYFLFSKFIRVMRSWNFPGSIIASLMAGSIGILLISITNPYLIKSDSLFLVSLPILAYSTLLVHLERKFPNHPSIAMR